MTDYWEIFPRFFDTHQAFIFADIGISEVIDTHLSQTLATINVTFKYPSPTGMPHPDEYDTIRMIEEQIEAFSENNNDHYVGRITNDGQRDLYIYTNNPQQHWQDFVAKLPEASSYTITAKVTDDSQHATYWDKLYPTSEDFRAIADLHLIRLTQEENDDNSQPRNIDHFIYFNKQLEAQPFIDWATRNNFTHLHSESHITDENQYCVRLAHRGTLELSDIIPHTITLSNQAEIHGGIYDGWETELVNTPSIT
ncbi:DUF695 domain-containing protein [Planctomycetota bacterium]|nr:DUF695 domain-containing protein [Planctomycetota bacterium]